ncbi:MAG: hypothetical protein ACODAJ_10100 [Planctomycetota bacterium]
MNAGALARCLAGFLLCGASLLAAGPPPARPAGQVYFEAEGFFSLQAIESEREGFFGSGYRVLGGRQAPKVVDRTVFLYGNPRGTEDYVVWVRALADGQDRRLAVEWIGENGALHLEPTHKAKAPQGFRWERAGVVKGKRRGYYQLRLNAVGDSRPVLDAVLLSAGPDYVPSNEVRPVDDPAVTGGDGQGTTAISAQTLVAGGEIELRVVYTAGRSGIGQGGALRFFLPESWSAPQSERPDAPGYVSASASRGTVRLAIDCHRPGKGAWSYSKELRHAHETFVRLRQGLLRAGDTVTIAYRGVVQPYAQSAADFRNEARAWYSPALALGVWTDANADGVYWPVPPDRSHRVEVVGGPAATMSVVVPSLVKVGEPFTIKLAALDRHRNPAPTYEGRLELALVRLEDGAPGKGAVPEAVHPCPAVLRLQDQGRIDEPGAYVVVVRDAAPPLEGRSNPVVASDDEPPYRIWWGDLHTHHRRCDGLRRFAEAAAHARDIAGTDLVALSPHACYITDGDLMDLWRVDRRFHEPGRFVPIFAYEWAAGGKGASHSVLYSERPMPLCFRAWGGGNVVRGRPAIHKLFEEHSLDVVEVPHHVRGVTDFSPRYTKAIEIYSQWGIHERGVVANLDAGLQACFFGTSDNHTGQPALQPIANRWAIHHHLGGLTAFLTPTLDRRSLFAAIDRRRVYATAACRIVGHFTVNGHAMGEAFTMASPKEPRTIRIEAVAATPMEAVTVLRNGQPLRTWKPEAAVARLEYVDRTPFGGPTDYYYVRIDQDETGKAWLTPVWVTYDEPVESPEQRFLDALEQRPNLARGKPVTVSFPGQITAGKPALVTDGKLDKHLGHGVPGRCWAQVDLGAVREIAFIRLWHYYRDGRAYHGNRLALSPTGQFAGEETVVFDSATDGEYRESPRGHLFAFQPVRARYIRNWLNCNTVNASSQWIELQAFASLPEDDE